MTTALQFVLCTLAAYSFACYDWKGKDLVFSLILVQLMVMPDQLLVVKLPDHVGPAAGGHHPGHLPATSPRRRVFLLRQNFKQVPLALAEAARIEGRPLRILLKIYVPFPSPSTCLTGWSPSAGTGTTSCGPW